MNIASPKVDGLAHRLARLTGEDVETALGRAIDERLSRIAAAPQSDRRTAMRRFFDRVLAHAGLGLAVRRRNWALLH